MKNTHALIYTFENMILTNTLLKDMLLKNVRYKRQLFTLWWSHLNKSEMVLKIISNILKITLYKFDFEKYTLENMLYAF